MKNISLCLKVCIKGTCFRYFSWDGRKFPDSKEILSTLAGKGRNMVTIIDPHIKVCV